MFLRRSAAALAVSAALCAAAAPAAYADAAPKLPDGLYGKADPAYDGVWRQSVALLALDAAGATPAKKAVDWLAGQQCDDGSFAAYRADPSAGCDPKKSPGDTNATGMAVQALSAVGGHGPAVKKAVDWLSSVQNEDGGWGYAPGSPSDANSVSVVIGALDAAGRDPGKVTEKAKDGAGPYDALLSLQLGCDAKKDERGAFAYQPGKDGKLAANDDATAAAALGALGKGVLGAGGGDAAKGPGTSAAPMDCSGGGKDDDRSPREAADAAAGYLTSVLRKNGGHLDSVMPGSEGKPDYANTADAVVALAAGGHRAQARASLDWLGDHLDDWDKATDDPAALGALMLAGHATGADPAKLAGTDLYQRLAATGPKPAAAPGHGGTKDAEQDAEKDGDGGGTMVWPIIGAGLVAGVGIGFLLSGRRRKEMNR